MKKKILMLILICAFLLAGKVFADCVDDTSASFWVDYMQQESPPESDTSSSAAAFQNYGAEGASDTGNSVGVMLDDARNNDQIVDTTTGYSAFSQNGYVYRVDADGRGFTQLGTNYQTGALIDLNTGQPVDYVRGYDSGEGGNAPRSGGGGVTAGGETLEFAPGNDFVKLEDDTYGFKMNDGNYYWYDQETGTMNPVDMSGVSSAGGMTSAAEIERRASEGYTLYGRTDNGDPVYYKDGNYFSDKSGTLTNLAGTSTNIDLFSGAGAGSAGGMTSAAEIERRAAEGFTLYGQTESGDPVYKDANGNYFSDKNGTLTNLAGTNTQMYPFSDAGTQAGSSSTTGGTQGWNWSSLGGGPVSSAGSWLGNLLGLNSTPGSSYPGGYSPGGSSGGIFSSTGGYSPYSAGGYSPGYSYSGYAGMGGGWNPANYLSTGLPAGSIYLIIQSLMMWVLSVFGFICIIGFVVSGVMYLTAAGDDEQQKKAKKAMYYSIMGVIVGLIGLVIIYAVNSLLWGASFF